MGLRGEMNDDWDHVGAHKQCQHSQHCYMVMRMCQMATNCRQDCRHNENWPLFRKKSGQFDFSLVTGRGLEPRT